MNLNLRKMKDEAAELARKGRTEKALRLYQQVLEQDPKDVAALSASGNLLRRLGKTKEAVKTFERLANCYLEGGFFLKSIAACKLVLEMAPEHVGARKMLGELCSQEPQKTRAASCVEMPAEPPAAPASVTAQRAAIEPAQPPPAQAEPAQTEPEMELEPEPEESQEAATFYGAEPEIELEPIDIEIETAAAASATPGESFEVEVSTPAAVLEKMSMPETGEARAAAPAPSALGVAEPAQESPSVLDSVRGSIPLLADLPNQALVKLVERMKMIRLRPGEWAVREGAAGDSMFLVVSGQVRVLKQRDRGRMWQLAVLGEGSFFGEMALLQGGKRAASVQAVKPTTLFEINRELMQEIAESHAGVKEVLEKFMIQRLLRNVMNTSPLFQPFNPPERIRLIERFVLREVEAGEIIVKQGEEGQGLFVVLHGTMEAVYFMEDGRELKVGELREGEVFGEISCLKKTGSTATVRARERGAVLRLPREDFEELVCSHPQVLELVDHLGEERLAMTLNTLAQYGVLL